MKIEAFKEKLGPEWAKLFEKFITSPDMDKIYERLRKDSANNKIYPASEDTFKAFKLVKPKDAIAHKCHSPSISIRRSISGIRGQVFKFHF